MKKIVTILFILIFSNLIHAEPFYQNKSDYMMKLQYGIEAQLDKIENHDKAQTSYSTSSAVSPDIEAVFTSASPWLTGVNWGGTTFNASISTGTNFFGSSLTDADLVPVRVIFSNTDSTLCQTFRRDLGYASNGVGVFPGTAWDMSDTLNPRRINICFVEDNNISPANFVWDPNTSVGKREYLFFMLSDYDGTGTTYAGNNVSSGGSLMDVVFAFWPNITSGHTALETLPASLDINLYGIKNARIIPDSSQNILTWVYKDTDPDHFNVYAGTTNPPPILTTVPGSVREFIHMGLTTGTEYFYDVKAATASDSVLAISKLTSGTTQAPYANMNLVGYLHEYNKYGDIWGYVDGGNEYALICVRDEGVSIVDITADPVVEVGFITPLTPGVDSKDIKIYQNYAILVNENDAVQIFDLTDVTNPTYVSSFVPDGGGSHNVLIEGDYMYVIGNHGVGGLEIVDISNPASPTEVGQFQPFYYHDIDIRNDTICATGIYGDGVDLIDVSNKTAPSLIARFIYPGSGAHNAEFSADGSHVFIGDEIGSSGNHIRIFDISNPAIVTLSSEIIIDDTSVVHNCYLIEDTLLVIGHYTLGVRIWNVADPTSPFEVAHYDSFLKNEYSYQGCWSVYPYFPSGKIVASDMQSGLFVLETNFASPPSCCVGLRGNVDNDAGDAVDISDLVYLVDFIFTGGPSPICLFEANVDGDPNTNIDISDLVFLVDFMFTSGPTPPFCDLF